MTVPDASSSLPLAGVRVLDLSRVLAGPWCTQTLADLGADVWKIEAPGQGDDTRGWTPPDVDGESTYFMCTNRSKRSLAIDLRHPEGRALARRLALQADVLVENYRLGALARFGLDYDTLSQAHPGLIYCSISGYGRTGPRAAEPGYDFVIQAESGLMSITGEPEGAPMKLGVAITDLVTGMNATQAVLAALLARQKTGKGQLIDLALLDSAVNVLANVGAGYLAAGQVPQRLGNGHPTVVPYQIFATADGAFALGVGNDAQFAALCAALGRPEWAEDERYRKNRSRALNRGSLVPALQQIFMTQSSEHWLARIRAAGIPAGPVRTVPQALDAPEIAARGLLADTPDARHGSLRLMRSPLHLRGTPPREPAAPPRLGEHTDEVLAQALGASAADIQAWRHAGAVA
ncbi:CoA transferase [Achromobacter denitrificans]|uniref:CaiB/BaiF CoA-transferase family protein n=3 Tax=Achromobacter denitrificans TaxID=32002 RepID=A0A3R9MQW8_ACHDE|nr:MULTISPECIES: CaiB/BaiF CoA-transferase family protein [Achromobacter]ASC66698.1 CoA transferase [Achromobacter denitrificans]MBV2158966.1 CoA transferase [Achromobacter denitrificans]MDF3857018.1 CaiB/BaiF CoA-transferase family protein [Achromobacter denitrificans]MDF3942120.1 CaiB/BaiF CoA-transferase family protein [Achromobacter denitrificans]MDX3880804.1 CaiB/BaiF CoA-transferase family protein [Achromobacter sp.]